MKNLKILKAGINEVSEVATLFDLYRQFYQQKSDIELAVKFISERIMNNESLILIAVEETGKIVGFCQIYPSYCSVIASPIYVLYDLFVLNSKRRIGAGKSLLIAAEEHAKTAGIARMDLTTAKTNLSAQFLYESLAWQKDDVFFTYNRNVIA